MKDQWNVNKVSSITNMSIIAGEVKSHVHSDMEDCSF